MEPVVLSANQPDTFYEGAGRIGRFRGEPGTRLPEDWVASTTPRHGSAPAGLSRLPDGTFLVDAIQADPQAWLGDEPTSAEVLVKLLDAGQRLPLHVHPTKAFARRHLASPYGKTEAWLILEAEPDASVHLGFSRDVSAEQVAAWFEAQDVAAMLAATNRIAVEPGDAILCPAGMPHAISEGVLLLEVQEPSDLSVLLEWESFTSAPDEGLLGLDLVDAVECVDKKACSASRLQELRSASREFLFPAEAAEFFRVDEIASGVVEKGFCVLVVVAGQGAMVGEWGRTPVARGTTVVVPAAAGGYVLSGELQVVRCRGPVSS